MDALPFEPDIQGRQRPGRDGDVVRAHLHVGAVVRPQHQQVRIRVPGVLQDFRRCIRALDLAWLEPQQLTHSRPLHRSRDRFLDREISWLQFNERVLQLAADETVPLLERARFLAIFASNLDEFFMVRVAGLKRRIATGIAVRSTSWPIPRSCRETSRRMRAARRPGRSSTRACCRGCRSLRRGPLPGHLLIFHPVWQVLLRSGAVTLMVTCSWRNQERHMTENWLEEPPAAQWHDLAGHDPRPRSARRSGSAPSSSAPGTKRV